MFKFLILSNLLILMLLNVDVHSDVDVKFKWQEIEAAGVDASFISDSFKPQPFDRPFYEIESILMETPIDNEYNAHINGSQIVTSYETCSRLPINLNANYSLFNSFNMSWPNQMMAFCAIRMPFLNIDPTPLDPSSMPAFSSAHKYCIATNERTFALAIKDNEQSIRPPAVPCMGSLKDQCDIELYGVSVSNDGQLVNVNKSLSLSIYDGLLIENISMSENSNNKFAMQFYVNLPARTSSKKLIYIPFEMKSSDPDKLSQNSGFHFR
jgi:hypothetical protein